MILFLKDHLGNKRTTLTEEVRTDIYPMAKMETASAASDNLYYFNIEATRSALPANYPVDNAYSNPNEKASLVRGDGNKIGASMILKVMAGDKFNLQANSWFVLGGKTPDAPVSPLNDIVNAIANSIPGISNGKIVGNQLTSTVLNPSVSGFLTDRDVSTVTGRPKAYLNWILFDEQMNPVLTNDGKNSGFQQVVGGGVYKSHTITEREITKNGYLYIYVSNETPNISVYFDQLQVTHIRGPLLQEEAYYPFGLEMKGISSNAVNTTGNTYKFNAGTELEERFDIDYYETPLRRYDAQVGRFTGVDVLAEKYFNQTTYNFGNNNPVYYCDPTGANAYNREDYQIKRPGNIMINDTELFSENYVSYFESLDVFGDDQKNSRGGTAATIIAKYALAGNFFFSGNTITNLDFAMYGKFNMSNGNGMINILMPDLNAVLQVNFTDYQLTSTIAFVDKGSVVDASTINSVLEILGVGSEYSAKDLENATKIAAGFYKSQEAETSKKYQEGFTMFGLVKNVVVDQIKEAKKASNPSKDVEFFYNILLNEANKMSWSYNFYGWNPISADNIKQVSGQGNKFSMSGIPIYLQHVGVTIEFYYGKGSKWH